MQKNQKYLMAAIIALITLTLLGILVFKTELLPLPVQKTYYSIVFKISPTAKTAEFLKRAHQSSQPKSGNPQNPYSFDYQKEDKPTIIKDSMFCEACHGSMKQKENGKPKYYIHNKMLSVKLVDFYCTNCHKKVDLGKRTGAHATIRVDRRLCTRCHESGEKLPEGGLKKVAGKLGKDDPLLFLVVRHGRDKKTGMQWINSHSRIAKEVGADKCRRCHKKGRELDFCTDCHKNPD